MVVPGEDDGNGSTLLVGRGGRPENSSFQACRPCFFRPAPGRVRGRAVLGAGPGAEKVETTVEVLQATDVAMLVGCVGCAGLSRAHRSWKLDL